MCLGEQLFHSSLASERVLPVSPHVSFLPEATASCCIRVVNAFSVFTEQE